jgi:hypothetical protein
MGRAIVGIAFRPRRATRALLAGEAALRTGLTAFAGLAAAYTFTVAWGWWNGFGAVVEPWLPIPAEDYYLWETFFAAPAYLVILIAFAGTTQLVAGAAGGRGRFEHVVAVLGLAMVLPTVLLMWLPETVLMVAVPGLRAEELGGFLGLPVWLDVARQLAVPVWMLRSGSLTVAEVHGVSVPASLLAVSAGLLPAAALAVTWIR